MSRSASWFLLVVGLAALLLARESRQPEGSLAGVDRAFFDWLGANVRPQRVGAGGNVTLVEIDDAVVATPGRWPFSPLECAAFLQAVGQYDPEVVLVEPPTQWADLSPGAGRILQAQALNVPRLLLSARLTGERQAKSDADVLPKLAAVRGGKGRMPDYPEITDAPNADLLPFAAAVGADNLPGSEDGSPVRDLPLLLRLRGQPVPTLTLQLLTLALRLAPSEVSVTLGSHVQFGDRLRLPVDRAGRALLDTSLFARINRVPLDDLALAASGQGEPPVRVAAELMRHGTVILGRTDQAARTLRLPGGRTVSPAEVYAWAAVSLPRKPSVRPVGGWGDALVVLLFAGLAVGTRGRRWSGVAARLAAGLVAYALGALWLFEEAGLWLPLALPLGLALVTGVLAVAMPEPAKATGV